MKKILLMLQAWSLCFSVWGQSANVITGSFIYAGEAYIYEYEALGSGIKKLTIYNPNGKETLKSRIGAYKSKIENLNLSDEGVNGFIDSLEGSISFLMRSGGSIEGNAGRLAAEQKTLQYGIAYFKEHYRELRRGIAAISDNDTATLNDIKDAYSAYDAVWALDTAEYGSETVTDYKKNVNEDSLRYYDTLLPLRIKRMDTCVALMKDLKTIIPDYNTSGRQVLLYDMTQEKFRAAFSEAIGGFSVKNGDTSALRKQWPDIADRLFFQILLREDDEDIYVATLKLNSNAVTFYNNKDDKAAGSLGIRHVDLEFSDGAIKNISIECQDSLNRIYHFDNFIPIPVNHKHVNRGFERQRIFCDERNRDIYLRVSELIDYNIILRNDQEDYSPRNSVVRLTPQSPVIELKKEELKEIFKFRTYSDLMGLSSRVPNGLIQTEGEVKINTNSKHYPSWLGYLNMFGHLAINAAYTKMDNNNSVINLSARDTFHIPGDSSSLAPSGNVRYHVRTLDLLKYQQFYLSGRSNIVKINFPKIVCAIEVPLTLGYGKAKFADSSANYFNSGETSFTGSVPFFKGSIGLNGNFMPDARYNLNLGFNLTYLSIIRTNQFRNNRYNNLRFADNGEKVLWTIYANMFVRTSKTNTVFVRSMMNLFTYHRYPDYFWQVQIGTQFSIFAKRS